MTVDLATGAATDIGLHGVSLGGQLTYSGLAFREDGTLLSLGAITVTFVVTAADAVDPSVSCQIASIASNEPINGLGDGDTAPDWSFTGLVARLRAERGGGGGGRVYTVSVSCTDDEGNSSTATSTVSVPQSLGK